MRVLFGHRLPAFARFVFGHMVTTGSAAPIVLAIHDNGDGTSTVQTVPLRPLSFTDNQDGTSEVTYA